VSKALLGRALAIAGIVSGLLAIGLPFADGTRYLDDGTTTAYLLVLLSLASWMPAEIGRDLFGAAAGAAAFGLLLFFPTTAGFDSLGYLRAGAWLGLCTLLIPIGAFVSSERGLTLSPSERSTRGPGLPVAVAGIALVVAGIWPEAEDGGDSFWDFSSSGHAVGIVMLLLAALNALLLLGSTLLPVPAVGDLDLVVAAATFGFVATGVITTAFENFGSLGAGAWLEACGGLLLLGGVAWLRRAKASVTETAASMPSPAH
jgi:hypothetical protein